MRMRSYFRRNGVCALLLALAACAPDEPARTTDAPTASAWTMQVSAAAGAALVLRSETGAERLRIACRRQPADLYVVAPVFRQIGSEERLTLGAGDALATLVVAQDTPPGAPLAASGMLTEIFIAAVAAGRPIGASYGASQIAPLAPPPELAARFADACRQALGERDRN